MIQDPNIELPLEDKNEIESIVICFITKPELFMTSGSCPWDADLVTQQYRYPHSLT